MTSLLSDKVFHYTRFEKVYSISLYSTSHVKISIRTGYTQSKDTKFTIEVKHELENYAGQRSWNSKDEANLLTRYNQTYLNG